MITLSLPEKMDKSLQAFATQAHLSKNEYALFLLKESLEERETYQRVHAISQRVARGEEKTISYEEALRQYENAHPSH